MVFVGGLRHKQKRGAGSIKLLRVTKGVGGGAWWLITLRAALEDEQLFGSVGWSKLASMENYPYRGYGRRRGPRCGATPRHDRSRYRSGRSCYSRLQDCDFRQAPLILPDAITLTRSGAISGLLWADLDLPSGGGGAGRLAGRRVHERRSGRSADRLRNRRRQKAAEWSGKRKRRGRNALSRLVPCRWCVNYVRSPRDGCARSTTRWRAPAAAYCVLREIV